MGKLALIGNLLKGIAGALAIGAANPIGSVVGALSEVFEVIVEGRGQGALKKDVVVDVSHVILQAFAKAGKLPAVPPKEELQEAVDAVVAVKNENGWEYASAGAKAVLEIDDVIGAIFRAGVKQGQGS